MNEKLAKEKPCGRLIYRELSSSNSSEEAGPKIQPTHDEINTANEERVKAAVRKALEEVAKTQCRHCRRIDMPNNGSIPVKDFGKWIHSWGEGLVDTCEAQEIRKLMEEKP